MRYHELRFVSSSELSRAFGELFSCQDVEGCLIDASSLTLRFSAPADQAARLLDHVQRRGELAARSFPRPGVTR